MHLMFRDKKYRLNSLLHILNPGKTSIKTDGTKEDHGEAKEKTTDVPEAEECLITENHDEIKETTTMIKEVFHSNRKRGRPRKEPTKKENITIENADGEDLGKKRCQ